MANRVVRGVARDSSGNAVGEPTVTVYLAGTATLATIFSTLGGAAKDNPFTGDTDGEWEFFVAAATSVKVKIEKTGFTTWEKDYIAGGLTDHGDLNGVADDDHTQYLLLAGRGGQEVADSVTFDDVLTKAPRLDVRAFGAVGDGATNDAAAINAAFAALRTGTAFSGGGVVYFPSGTYLYNGAGISHNPASGTFQPVLMVGDGPQSSTIRFTGVTNAQAVLLASQSVLGSNATKGYGILNMRLETALSVPLLKLTNLHTFRADNFWLKGGTVALEVSECSNNYISNGRITDWTTHGIVNVSDVAGDHHYADISLTAGAAATGNGFRYVKALASGGGTVYLHRVKCFSAPNGNFFHFESTAGAQRLWVFLENCVVDAATANSGGAAFYFKDVNAIHAVNCHVTNHGTDRASVQLDNADEVSWVGGATNADTGASASDFYLLNSCTRVAIHGVILKGNKTNVRVDGTTHTVDLAPVFNLSATNLCNDWTKLSLLGHTALALNHAQRRTAGDFRIVNAALGVLGERHFTLLLDEASADDRAYTTFHVPDWWGERAGTAVFSLLYTGTVSSTSNIRLAVRASADKLTDDITAAPAINGTEWLFAGPSTANQLQTATFGTTLALVAGDRIIGVRLQRDGTHANDAYTGDLHIVSLTATLFPS